MVKAARSLATRTWRRRTRRALLGLSLTLVAMGSGNVAFGHERGPDHDGERAPARGALALESRLIAPCCWIQTLDVHESELATELRDEIDARLSRGEPAERIEDDLASRYGERIRAVPKGKDTRSGVPVLAGGVMLGSMAGLVFALRAWRRRADQSAAEAQEPERDGYDDRLDDELARLDEEP